MRRSYRVFPVVLLLITVSVSAAPSAFPTPGPDNVGTGPERFPSVDTRWTESQLLQLLDSQAAPTEFISLEGPDQLAVTSDDPFTALSSELTPDPLLEVFADPPVMTNDSMRIADVIAPSQPPILVPSLDTFFTNAPELDIVVVLLLAGVLYRFGAKSLRFY